MQIKGPLRFYRIVLSLLFMLMILISFLTILPFLQGEVTVEPVESSMDWGVEEDSIVISGEVWVNNSGYFDIEDLVIEFEMSPITEEGESFTAVERREVGDVVRDESRNIEISLSKSIEEIPEEMKKQLATLEGDVNMSVKSSGYLTFGLIGFEVDYSDEHRWRPPFAELDISDPEYSERTQEVSAQMSFINRYPGTLDLTISLEVYDEDGKIIGSTAQTHTVESKRTFEERIMVEVDDVPSSVVLKLRDRNTGLEHQEDFEVGER
ncbi:MAG: hypothetical protein ACLFVL_02940 [Candidatus Aenigmatarchaeota archaeon]